MLGLFTLHFTVLEGLLTVSFAVLPTTTVFFLPAAQTSMESDAKNDKTIITISKTDKNL